MKFSGAKITKKAEISLKNCLAKVPFVKIEDIRTEMEINGLQVDMKVSISLPSKKFNLIIALKNNGQPRFAREAVNQLLRFRNIPDSYGVFIATFISPDSAEICQKDGIGYIDFSGNCLLSFGEVYIEQKGNPNAFAKKRDLRSLYSPKAERVLRVLLNRLQKTWKVKEMADEAEVSLGQASNVKKLLNDREWLNLNPNGFSLNKPMKLLEEWAENYNFRKNDVREFYSIKSPPDIEADIADICERNNLNYALTVFSGAARLAPSVRYQRAMIYVEESFEDVISDLELKPVSSGANVSLLYPYDEGVFYGATRKDDMIIASPIQIYLDLIGFRGRGEEAAETLLREVISPQW